MSYVELRGKSLKEGDQSGEWLRTLLEDCESSGNPACHSTSLECSTFMYLSKFLVDLNSGLENNLQYFDRLRFGFVLGFCRVCSFSALGPRCLSWSHLYHREAGLPWILTLTRIDSTLIHSPNVHRGPAVCPVACQMLQYNDKLSGVPLDCGFPC